MEKRLASLGTEPENFGLQIRRLIQLCVVFYVGFFALWMKKGYQDFSQVESSVTTKVKGTTTSYLDANSSANKGNPVLVAHGFQ